MSGVHGFVRAGGTVVALSLLAGLLWNGPVAAQAGDPPPVTVQPGAPGEPTRTLDSADMAEMEQPGYAEADVRFVQGMIRHHLQALEMVDVLRERTTREDLLQLGLRIEISQEDEIELMERWLRQRDEAVPTVASATDDGSEPDAGRAPAAGRTDADGRDGAPEPAAVELPPGMLTPRQMASLVQEPDPTFELRFLELMIEHHEAALEMVDRLFGSPGAGQVPSVFHIAAEVQADQAMEIQRMREMLEEVGR